MKGKDHICLYCMNWLQKREGDYAVGICQPRRLETPPIHSCPRWTDDGSDNTARQILESIRRQEEQRKRRPGHGGRKPRGVIGVKDGVLHRWDSLRECAEELGTTVQTLRIYIYKDKPYDGYTLDYAAGEK